MHEIIAYLAQQVMLIQLLVVAGSVVGLWYGSEVVISGARNLARTIGIPEMIIGLTVVSMGSSSPEMFVNISAGLRGADSVGVGNIVGSCFVQISFILGICVIVGGTMREGRRNLMRDGSVLLGSIILLFLFGQDSLISRPEAIFMMCLYVGYLAYLVLSAVKSDEKLEKKQSRMAWHRALFYVVLGIGTVWLSSEFLIGIGIAAGERMGLSQGIIGLLSGIGTSIPELSISLLALLRHSEGISVGNILGSNITDPLFSLGIGATLANGYQVSDFLLWTAIPTWFVASFSAMLIFFTFQKLTRPWAVLLILYYLSAFYFFL